jgi:hypothetical protein
MNGTANLRSYLISCNGRHVTALALKSARPFRHLVRTGSWPRFGVVFEDFLIRETEVGTNIIDDYLKRSGWKESASAKAYRCGLRNLYEVSNIVPNTSFLSLRGDGTYSGHGGRAIDAHFFRSCRQRMRFQPQRTGSDGRINPSLPPPSYSSPQRWTRDDGPGTAAR